MSKAHTKQDLIDHVVDSLRGTCETFDRAAEAHGLSPMDAELCEALDQQIFNCCICGWWCDLDEMADNDFNDQVCGDCADADI